MGRREKLEIYDTGNQRELLLEALPPPHRIFYAVFRQAEKDIEDFVKIINSGKADRVLKEKGWTKELGYGYTNLKESLDFFSNKNGHFKDLADCANVDLSNRQYKERIAMNLSVGKTAQDKLHQLEGRPKKQISKPKETSVLMPGIHELNYYSSPSGV